MDGLHRRRLRINLHLIPSDRSRPSQSHTISHQPDSFLEIIFPSREGIDERYEAGRPKTKETGLPCLPAARRNKLISAINLENVTLIAKQGRDGGLKIPDTITGAMNLFPTRGLINCGDLVSD